MEPTPPEPDQSDRTKTRRGRVTHAGWSLTQEAFEKLLSAFSPDQEEASRLYLNTHLKLVRFFEWHACGDPEHLVDGTFNRVARRLIEGQSIDNLIGYVYGVARLIFMETLKDQERTPLSLETHDVGTYDATSQDDPREARLNCLDKCLNALAPESRALILDYYCSEKPAKEIRRQLAERMKIQLNALRIRAHRIRTELEKCVESCLEGLSAK